MQPVTIKRGSFEAQLYDVGYLMDLPLANIRRLWKIMFDTADENRDAIAAIQEWLPNAIVNTEAATRKALDSYRQTAKETEDIRRTVAAFGSVATKDQKTALANAQRRLKAAEKRATAAKAKHERAKKLQTIFNEIGGFHHVPEHPHQSADQ